MHSNETDALCAVPVSLQRTSSTNSASLLQNPVTTHGSTDFISDNINSGTDVDQYHNAIGTSRTTGQIDHEAIFEFGGPIGATLMMVLFPILMIYLWICIEFYNGQLTTPDSWSDLFPFLYRMVEHVSYAAVPTWWAWSVYWTFTFFQVTLAVVMPGPVVKGLPVPSLDNQQLDYLCNGISCLYVTLLSSAVLHATDLFPLQLIVDRFGQLLSVSILSGFFVSIITYAVAILRKKQHRMSGYFMYDFFMGASLNPRLGSFDFKMFTEIRIPWVILFYISLSSLIKQIHILGYASPNMWFMVLAHFLYMNACMKGEECIPSTWDIFYEKWGFMLIFWNMVIFSTL
ncbi:hypothetical protein BASA81_013166 [Batrachochytrium salamandrivorans]|nr:hypothetical protein BASA81_013166 [Batrachochytrium salamandrivorans]